MMTTLTNLSSEVIDIILCYSDISFEDIVNLRCVCKQFRWAAKAKKYCFLKEKFFQRWPTAKKYYDQHKKKIQKKTKKKRKLKENNQQNKKRLGFIETGIDYVKQLRNYKDKFQIMFEHSLKDNYIRSKDKDDFEEELLKKLVYNTKNYIKLSFFMDEMKHLLTQPPRTGYDLTERYYYIRLFDYLIMIWRNHTLTQFEERPHTNKFLEQSATILAQQLQFGKNVFYSNIKRSLDNIALEVLNFLKEKHHNHLIFSTPAEYFSHWKENNIDENYWNKAERIKIMYALTEYIFEILNFRVINTEELEYMCIDYVLENKCGYDIILYIIFQSVARRLGLRCDIVTIHEYEEYEDRYFFCIKLFWFSEYVIIRILDDQYKINGRHGREISYYYLNNRFDKFPGWIIKEWIVKDQFDDSIYENIYQKRTLKSMLNAITESEYDNYFSLFDDELHDDNRGSPFDNNRLSVTHWLKNYVSQTRPQEIKFSVGMIVTHSGQSTDCSIGVIIGWHQAISDNSKIIHAISKNVMALNICSKCSTGFSTEQAHYLILTKNHKLCYVKEDDITLTKPNWIENRKIYYYFRKFENTHYVPNEMLTEVYPDDAAITAKTIFKN